MGSVAYNPPEGKDYKWYISGIYCQLGDYMPPTTFYGNQKQPLIWIPPMEFLGPMPPVIVGKEVTKGLASRVSSLVPSKGSAISLGSLVVFSVFAAGSMMTIRFFWCFSC